MRIAELWCHYRYDLLIANLWLFSSLKGGWTRSLCNISCHLFCLSKILFEILERHFFKKKMGRSEDFERVWNLGIWFHSFAKVLMRIEEKLFYGYWWKLVCNVILESSIDAFHAFPRILISTKWVTKSGMNLRIRWSREGANEIIRALRLYVRRREESETRILYKIRKIFYALVMPHSGLSI